MALGILSDFIVSLVCFLGLFVGLLIGFMAKEELKAGKKYFLYLQKVIFILVVFFVFYDFGFWLLGLLFVVFFSILLFQIKKDYHRVLYFVLAAFLFMSFFEENMVVPALVFFYGFPTGSLFYLEEKQKKVFDLVRELFFRYWYFLLIIIILLLLKLIL